MQPRAMRWMIFSTGMAAGLAAPLLFGLPAALGLMLMLSGIAPLAFRAGD